MKPWLKWTGLILIAAVFGLALAFAFTVAVKPQRGNTPITLDQAVESARQYLTSYGNPDLVLTEVMQFSSNFYAEVEEKNTGIHAFELLIDRYTGAVVFRTRPEYDVEHSLRAHGWNDGPLGRATGRRAGCDP